MRLAAWQISGGKPAYLDPGVLELEKVLENWIAEDPELIERNLLVIQRQLHVDGGFLDLLCVDLQGRATVVEIKRGKLIRETIAQAIDYASTIASSPTETLRRNVGEFFKGEVPDHPGLSAMLSDAAEGEPEVSIMIAGVGAEPGLERMIEFLGGRFAMPIRAVSFEVFELASGEQLLVREETEPDEPHSDRPRFTIAAVIARAGGPDSDAGRKMLRLKTAAEDHGLHVRPYTWALTFTPQERKNRYLVTIWCWPDRSEVGLEYSAEAFAEFFPLEADQTRNVLGLEGDGQQVPIRSDADAERWVAALDELFELIGANANGAGSEEGESLA
jgi:hypothetical protein